MENMKDFKQIPGYDLYWVNRDGSEVRKPSGMRKQVLSQTFHPVRGKEWPNGYMYVTLNESNERYGQKPTAVHRLVALAWLDKPEDESKKQVNHKDGNKLNNDCDNLEWVTAKENVRHSFDSLNRVVKRGSESPLFGRRASSNTKAKMSRKKMGSKHPKFRGYYVVNGLSYPSAQAAQDATGINAKMVLRKCKSMLHKPDFYFIKVEK